ncbi:peroxidase family protein, partial [Rhizobium sp. BK661]|uniref:peroxidase family protein n=1 Tax=Rhizobium sp. BK661 TaxID=2586991 RepID=UPI0021675BBC
MTAFTLNLQDMIFILRQIKIAEAHAAGTALTEIYVDSEGNVVPAGTPGALLAIPDPHVPAGLRTVDGTYNNVVPGRETWGAADQSMPRLLDGSFVNDADGDTMPFGPPGSPAVTNNDYGVVGSPSLPSVNGGHTGNVADADPRIISNLVVDMSINNPAAIFAALTYAGSEDPQADLERLLAARVTQAEADAALATAQTAVATAEAAVNAAVAAYVPGDPLLLDAIQTAAEALTVAEETHAHATAVAANPSAAFVAFAEELGLTVNDQGTLVIPNIAPDEGLSAPFNAWMTFFGQFFDHGLDLISKGNNGTVFIPLQPDDPLYVPGGSTNFMVLTRAAPTPDGSQTNTTTSFVDQNQTYTSHASHQVFLREYVMRPNDELVDVPVATGKLLDGAANGLPTWKDIKDQARELLGIELSDRDVINLPLLRTDAYGEFIRGDNGLPLIITGIGADNIPNTEDDSVVEGNLATPVNTFSVGALRTGHAFLDDIAHQANPFDSQTGQFKAADADDGIGTPPPVLDGFDAVVLSDGTPGVNVDAALGNWTETPPPGWDITGGFGGVYDPTATVIAETGHGGGNVVFLDSAAVLTHDTGVLLQGGRTYSLTLNVGDRTDQTFGGGTVQLVAAGGAILSSLVLPIPGEGGWLPVTLSSGVVPAGAAGQELRIVVTHGGGTGQQILIDDVRLTSNIAQYDDELLDRHFITGDGRGNENIGLTAVHHIFHSEHNRQIDSQKLTILNSGDLDFINEWLVGEGITGLPAGFASMTALQQLAVADTLDWDGERLFQGARFATEMQYQHLVFEEFARKIQPAIDPFVFNNITDINPSIFSEFANTVYRFGHSMLTENMPRVFIDANGAVTSTDNMGLITAFLNPVAFDNDGTVTADQAAGAIVRGMTIERGNEIDEFITGALRNSLLGLPLDLASINIARGRDTGIPTLNDARTQLYAATGSSFLTPYDSWTDFAANLKNPISVVNFIAAYGTHSSITGQTTVAGKRDAAWALVFGDDSLTGAAADAFNADRLAFLNSTGTWTAANSGLNAIDLWIGGLAEKKMPFGGFLGSTFNAIFEAQLENLQDGDRLYYLTRTQGQNFLNMLEQNSFAKMIMANTDIAQPGPDGIRGTADDIVNRHMGVDSFGNYDFVLEVNAANQADYNGTAAGVDPLGTDAALEAMGLGKVARDDPGTPGVDVNYLRFTGGEHIVAGGTSGNDTIITDFGDDGIWGDAGDDRIESGAGVDLVNGGAGDDILTDSGDSGDFIKGDEGNDVIANSNGLDILMGGIGKDAIFVGVDDTEVFGGEGDDFIVGGEGVDLLMGNEGDDWIEGGGGFDTTAGDNSELFFNSVIKGHDVMFAGNEENDFDGESGDDIMVQGESVMRNEGMFGFDWAIFKGVARDAHADMNIPIFTTEQEDILRNRFDKVEALSGWDHNDTLIGDERTFGEIAPGDTVATTENIFFNDGLDAEGLARIAGLNQIVDLDASGFYQSGNVLLGGGGHDLLQGNGGDDIIDGDRWLNVRIRITSGSENSAANQIATVDSMRHVFTAAEAPAPSWIGRSLFELLVDRTVRPDQMHIVREVLTADGDGDIDTAVFRGSRSEYEIEGIDFNDDGDNQTIVRHLVNTAVGGVAVNDGVDKVSNIERLQFADQTVELVEVDDEAPVGNPVIEGFAQIGQLLKVQMASDGSLAGVTDADNPDGGKIFPPLIIEWQIETDPGVFVDTGFRGPSFTPATDGEFEVGADVRVRAIVRYTDANGIPYAVASLPTDPLVPATNLVATEGDDVLVGTPGDDTIDGLGGNDIIFGLAGDDDLRGGAGDDEIFGGLGDDTLAGGDGNDILDGGDGDDTAVFAGNRADFVFEINAEGQLEVVGTNEEDAVISIENFQFNDGTVTIAEVQAGLPDIIPTDGPDTITGTEGADDIDALGGNDTINALGGDDDLVGGLGNDVINAGAGDDTIAWEVGDGRDIIDGGVGTDRLRIRGDNNDETFFVEDVADYLARTGLLADPLQATTEIVVSRSVGAGASIVVAELAGMDEIDINGGGGNDTFVVSGDFAGTDLDPSTITIDGTSGDDTVDITGLDSQHRIVFRSNGGDDTIVGTLRPQDVVELAPGSVITGYTLSDNTNGTRTLSNGTHSITFTGVVPPQFVPQDDDPNSGPFAYTAADLAGLKNLVNGLAAFEDDDDTEGFGGVRSLSGHGNNEQHADWGAADEPFIRITNAHYGEYDAGSGNNQINPIFEGLNPRNISNVLGAQEANLAKNASNANIFFMAFGQYFDHGLDFLPKGGNGTIQIGAPGSGAPGSGNPADLTRGTVHDIDENGVSQHLNKTSPFVDQNQSYGSHELVGQFLRESDGNQGFGSHLLQGAVDPSNTEFRLLPTLRELITHHWQANTIFRDAELPGGQISFRDYYAGLVDATGHINETMLPQMTSDFMGSGHALLLDANPFISALDHYVVGDGRGNENFALTSIHTIWARNHNYHVELLEQSGFQGTAEELFQAAKMVNEAEYQRVVFTEFADMLIGGIRGDGDHGFEEYNPNATAAISHEFAAAVYRVGHSLIGQTMTVIGPDGEPRQVALYDAFLNPSNDPGVFKGPLPPGYVPQPGYGQLGVNSILGGIVTQSAEEVDFNIVDAVRNDLVRINADLFSFNVARAWDVGLGTLNQVRMDLAASTDPYVREALGYAGNLSAYTSWEDFQARNGLSDIVINQFRQAYPDLVLQAGDIASFQAINPDIQVAIQADGTGLVKGIDRVDLWVGGLAEKHINGGMVGQTFWVVLQEQFDRLQEADRFYYLNRFDNFDFYEDFIDGQEFADIVARNTGLTSLSESIFETEPLDDDDDDQGGDDDDGDHDDDDDDDNSGPGGGDDNDDDDDDDDSPSGGDDDDGTSSGGDDDDDDSSSGGDDGDGGTDPLPVAAQTLIGTVAGDVLIGAAGADTILAGGGGDIVAGDAGNDILRGEDGDDVVTAGDGNDSVTGGAGDDELHGGAGDDMLFGNAGKDMIHGEAGFDFIEGGAGEDQVWAGDGDDTVIASAGDGDDQ